MDLRHLRYFREIARELSYSKAAKNLHVAQPALSVRIRDLEQELRVQLFRRLGPRIELTQAGVVLLRHVEHLLDGLDLAVTLTRRASAEARDQLTVGFVGSATYSFLPLVLREFRMANPNVDLQLEELASPRQVEALLARKIDVGFLRLPVLERALGVEVVHKEPFVLAVPRGHRLERADVIHPKELADDSFVMFPPGEGAGFHDQVVLLCQLGGFAPRVIQYAAPMQNVIGLVGAGMGVAIVPRSVSKIQAPGVAYVAMGEGLPMAETAVAWRAENENPLVSAFVQTARRWFAQAPGSHAV